MQPLSSPSYIKIIGALRSSGVLPVFHHAESAILIDVLKLAHRCGVTALEFLDQRDRRSLRSFAALAKEPIAADVLLGAGAVHDVRSAEYYIRAGARFIASPFLHPAVAQVCARHHVPWIPGCSTIDDVAHAQALGANIVTILPGNVLGAAFIKKVVAAYPHLMLLSSGSVSLSENNLMEWFDGGGACIRLGEMLFGREKDIVKIEQQLYRALQRIKPFHLSTQKMWTERLFEAS